MNPHFFGSPEAIKEEEEDRPQEIPIFHLGVHEIYTRPKTSRNFGIIAPLQKNEEKTGEFRTEKTNLFSQGSKRRSMPSLFRFPFCPSFSFFLISRRPPL